MRNYQLLNLNKYSMQLTKKSYFESRSLPRCKAEGLASINKVINGSKYLEAEL